MFKKKDTITNNSITYNVIDIKNVSDGTTDGKISYRLQEVILQNPEQYGIAVWFDEDELQGFTKTGESNFMTVNEGVQS